MKRTIFKSLLFALILSFMFTLLGCSKFKQYTLIFDVNGGEPTESMLITATSKITIPSAERTGYTFMGWFIDDETFETVYTPAYEHNSSDDLTVYAKWELIDYTITYHLDDGIQNSLNPATYTFIDQITFAEPTKTGLDFEGFYTNDAFTGSPVTEITAGTTGNINLYAKWGYIEYSITYHLDGGINSPNNPSTYTSNSPTIILETPTQAGKNFSGWFRDSAFNEPITEITTGSEGDFDLYATWEDAMPDMDIVVLTDGGNVDDGGMNQSVWDSVNSYAQDNGLFAAYIVPFGIGETEFTTAIDIASLLNPDVIICIGFHYEVAVYYAQNDFGNIHFILLDGEPHDETYANFAVTENTLNIFFQEEEPSFMAGYAAVYGGLTDLAFIGGMAVPMVTRFGIGYIAGAYYAANELDIDITFTAEHYEYAGTFSPSDQLKNQIKGWYSEGVDVVFSICGEGNRSIIYAAEESTSKWVIGVDYDMSHESTRIITSAVKFYGAAAIIALEQHYQDLWDGGQSIHLGANDDCVGLPSDFSRFGANETAVASAYADLLVKIQTNVVSVPDTVEELTTFLNALGVSNPTLVSKILPSW